jgi:hypothetical protein
MRRWIVFALGAAGLVAGSTLLRAKQPPTPPGYGASAIPGVSISITGDGGAATSSMSLRHSDWEELLFYAGDRDQGSLCPGGTSSAKYPLALQGQRPLVVWRIEARLQSFEGATAMIEVRWRREVQGAGVEPARDFDQTFVWRAEEGASRVIDLVREMPAKTPLCDTKTLDMRYVVSGPEDLGQAAIGYDVWLLHPSPTGDRGVRHLHTSGEQGSTVSFAFPTVWLPERPVKPGDTRMSVSMRVEGWVIGRVRPDGRIDLAVDAGRMVGRSGTGLGLGSFGRTRLIVSSGETIELQPPPLYGTNDADYERVLGGGRTAIRVRAKRLW